MSPKSSKEIRQDFFDFFAAKGHTIVPSAPVIPQGDSTLLFTNAGMNQFKDVFLGTGSRDYTRVANTQKCIRVTGKHNDLDAVGRDTYHHTFFEMLGNWSFGDYFKKESIRWAWELLTEVWKLPKEHLYATYFGGDAEDGLEADEETRQLWLEETDIPKENVLSFDKKDNFWEMGDTGPCGPCTEIHLDTTSGKEPDAKVNGDCGRIREIWNLVFIQFNRQADGKLQPLPAKHVDTGMGFERLVATLQGKESNYEIDVFTPILAHIGEITQQQYHRGSSETDVAFQVIADHVRALSVAFADGALPGNTKRGHVLRRILRRASLFGKKLHMEEPFIYRLVPTVAEIFADTFPEIAQRQEHISLLIKSEEENFGKTLDRGLSLFHNLVEEVTQSGSKVIPGERAYELYHRDGFPKDLVELMAEERSLQVDQQGWEKAEQEHRERSKGEGFGTTDIHQEIEGLPASKFLGYDTLTATGKIVKLIGTDKLVVDQTPFYAEAGGQVGDTGVITGQGFRFKVEDTQKIGDIYLHLGELEQGNLSQLPEQVELHVNAERREKIMANHTATHLLHRALKDVLGEHANQQGSVVAPDRLRFDISHPQRITEEELYEIEKRVNQAIFQNFPVASHIDTLENAKEQGAVALFGEKYGEEVRVITIDNFSTELCGGTHAPQTGHIGSFKISSESAVQAGVRRIEALTRETALAKTQETARVVNLLKNQVKAQDEEQLIDRVAELQKEIKELKAKAKKEAQKELAFQKQQILDAAAEYHGCKMVLKHLPDAQMDDLRTLADFLRKSGKSCLGLVCSSQQGKAPAIAFVSDDLVAKGQHAGEILKTFCQIAGGGGNMKRKDFAQGQGKDAGQIKSAFSLLQENLEKSLAD